MELHAKKPKNTAQEKTPWKHNPQQKLDLCLTCGLQGHSWTDCISSCDKCGEVHNGGVCPLFPDLYPGASNFDHYPRASNFDRKVAANRLKKEADDLERLVHQREQELERLTGIEQLVLGRKGPALATAKPHSNSQRGAALRLLGFESWAELDPSHPSKTPRKKKVLRKQWNDEALGTVPCAQSSLLFQAMVARKESFHTLSQ